MTPQFHRVPVNGREIACLEVGRGPAIVLIHGLVGDHRAWAPTIERLKDRYRVIAPDNRGAGASTQHAEPISFQDMADDTLAVMTALGVEQAHIVGRSTGGGMAQLMALTAPDRIASIAMLASFAKLSAMAELCGHNMRDTLQWTGSWEAFARHALPYFVTSEFMRDNPARCEAILQIIGSSDRLQACYFAQADANYAHDTLDRLHAITCPTLIAAGSQDPLCGPLSAHEMAERIAGSELVIFEGRSHFFMMEEEERFHLLIEDWLERRTVGA